MLTQEKIEELLGKAHHDLLEQLLDDNPGNIIHMNRLQERNKVLEEVLEIK